MQRLRQMLFNAGHQTLTGKRDAARGGREGAVQHLQQGAFAATVMADETDPVAFLQGEGELNSGPKAVSTWSAWAVSNVLIVNLLKSYRHANASSKLADDNPVSRREGIA